MAVGYNSTLGNATSAYGLTTPQAASAATNKAANTDTDAGASSAQADSVTLSEAAKAYLASTPVDAATLAADARKWFDQQYKDNGITSPLIDGKVAVDFSSQSRATLSAIAANSQSLFSKDETVAAAKALSDRFDTAMTPHVVIARHVGDYASLYQAADKYLEQADTDERATPLWQSQKAAVADGLAKAKLASSKAPQTDGNDPVAALLVTTSQATPTAGTDDASVASNARAMLDAQAAAARDAGTTLVFDPNRKVGQQADFSQFDNQSLAIVTLNSDGSFSPDEARAAKKVLDTRNRQSILAAFNSGTTSDVSSQSLALLNHYSSMSAAEKAAMGYTDAMQSRLIANYRTAQSLQGSGFLGASTSTGTSDGATSGSLLSYM